jgi:hypothetical protein
MPPGKTQIRLNSGREGWGLDYGDTNGNNSVGDFPTFGENSPSTLDITGLFSCARVGYPFALVGACSGYFEAQTGKLFSRLSAD